MSVARGRCPLRLPQACGLLKYSLRARRGAGREVGSEREQWPNLSTDPVGTLVVVGKKKQKCVLMTQGAMRWGLLHRACNSRASVPQPLSVLGAHAHCEGKGYPCVVASHLNLPSGLVSRCGGWFASYPTSSVKMIYSSQTYTVTPEISCFPSRQLPCPKRAGNVD